MTTTTLNLTPATVSTDGDEGELNFYEALVDDEGWNGFAVPYFTFEVASKVWADFDQDNVENRGEYRYGYNAERDEFFAVWADETGGMPAEPTDEQFADRITSVVVDGVKRYPMSGFMFHIATPPATAEDVPAMIAKVKAEVLADIASGLVPATVATFSELHDYSDANCYGGMCDDDAPRDWVRDRDDAGNSVQNAVNVWLVAGRPESPAIIPADIDPVDPWYFTVVPFEGGFRAQMWERNRRSEANGAMLATGTGAIYPTVDEATAWAVHFVQNADGRIGNTVAVVV